MTKVGARVIKAEVSNTSKQIYDDEFSEMYGADIIAPPYNQIELKTVAEYSTILQQCIDAYRTNIVGFGFAPTYTFDFNASNVEPEKKSRAEVEWTLLEEFIKYQNFEESTETVYGYMIEDRESTGNGYIEVIRDVAGDPAETAHMDSRYMRVCTKTVHDEVENKITRGGKPETLKRWRQFRRYAQMVNGKTVYFKEYGDKRVMNSTNGKFDENTPLHLRATEVIHFKIGSGTYGVPRWIGHLITLYGARKAEELNYMYFKNGRHMPAAILVENGQLTDEAYNNLQDYMNDMQGVEQAHKFLLLEVEGITDEGDVKTDGDKISNVKIEIKSLAEMIQQDALFLEYDAQHRSKLRSAFRLPPLYTGEADEYNKATADTARKITEEQVFQPERSHIAGKMNTLFLPELELTLVKMVINGPDFRDPVEMARALAPFITANGVAPNDLRDPLGKILGKTLEEFDDEMYNYPIPRGMGSRGGPTELPILKSKDPGQQTELVSIMKDLRDALEDLRNG